MQVEESSGEVLDLLARIRAQQRRFDDAETLWNRLLRRDPDNLAFRAALRCIARQRGRSGWLAALLRLRRGRGDFSLTECSRRFSAGLRLDVPGAFLRIGANELTVTLDSGVFSEDSSILLEVAKPGLSVWGRQLEPYIGSISIDVTGYTGGALRSIDRVAQIDSALAMARAVAVFNHLIDTTKLPGGIFSLRASGGLLPACPEDRTQDRTGTCAVVIRVSSRRDRG